MASKSPFHGLISRLRRRADSASGAATAAASSGDASPGGASPAGTCPVASCGRSVAAGGVVGVGALAAGAVCAGAVAAGAGRSSFWHAPRQTAESSSQADAARVTEPARDLAICRVMGCLAVGSPGATKNHRSCGLPFMRVARIGADLRNRTQKALQGRWDHVAAQVRYRHPAWPPSQCPVGVHLLRKAPH